MASKSSVKSRIAFSRSGFLTIWAFANPRRAYKDRVVKMVMFTRVNDKNGYLSTQFTPRYSPLTPGGNQ